MFERLVDELERERRAGRLDAPEARESLFPPIRQQAPRDEPAASASGAGEAAMPVDAGRREAESQPRYVRHRPEGLNRLVHTLQADIIEELQELAARQDAALAGLAEQMESLRQESSDDFHRITCKLAFAIVALSAYLETDADYRPPE
jgi:hypothetical protein